MDRAELARRLGAEMAVGEAPRWTVVEARAPAEFRSKFTAAVAAGGPVFLADPGWGERERGQFNALIVQADAGADDGRGWLMIPTGGSSGQMKLARHDEESIGAAVRGFAEFFGGGPIHALGVLPLHHVSGLMAWLRCVLTEGTYRDGDWAEIVQGRRPEAAGANLSLVPTQLARLLGDPAAEAWLRRFGAVFLGGGPAWPELVEEAATAGLPLAFSYGMTETAAMVTALRPAEFVAGRRGCGVTLPQARVLIEGDGEIVIASEALFRGYWPDRRSPGPWSPGDLGKWDEVGSLHVLGRRDALIISGGEKINPAEVESALRDAGAPAEVVVCGMPDPRWGQRVVVAYPGPAAPPELESTWRAALAGRLAVYKHPKQFLALTPWPRNAAGKVDRARLLSMLVDPGGEVGR